MAPRITEVLLTLFLLGSGPHTAAGASLESESRPTFQKDVQPFLQAKCIKCHSGSAYIPDTGLGCTGRVSFEDKPLGRLYVGGPNHGKESGCPDLALYERLTQLRSPKCYSRKYVVPGDTENSFLLMKMEGRDCDGKKIKPPPVKLEEHEIEMIRRWIKSGAPRS